MPFHVQEDLLRNPNSTAPSSRGTGAFARQFFLCCALAWASALVVPARDASAAAVAPSVRESVRGTPEATLLGRNVERYHASRAWGVDRVYPKFALDLAKFPDRKSVCRERV